MIFKKLTATFGSLKNSSLELKPGLNIIEGANESGKSTWCAFIRSMLYGIDSRERDTKDKKSEKNRYRPWSGETISGRIELGDPDITVERSGTAASPLREFRAYTPTGSDAGYTAADFGESMVGASREVFERSAFVLSPPLPSGSDELEKQVLATVSGGDESQSGAAAASQLRDWQRKLRYNRRGMIPELEQRIADLRREADECAGIDAQLAASTRELDELRAKKDELDRELAAHKLLEQARASQQLTEARERLATANAERSALVDDLPSGVEPGELQLLDREWSAERSTDDDSRRRGSLEHEITLIDAQMEPIVGRTPETDAAQAELALRRDAETAKQYVSRKHTPNVVLGAVLLLLAAGCAVFAVIKSFYLFIPAVVFAAVAVILFVAAANDTRRAQRLRGELLSKYSAADEGELLRLADLLAPLIARRNAVMAELSAPAEQRATPAFDRLSEIFGTTDQFEIGVTLKSALKICDRIAAVDTTIGEARSAIAALENAGVTEAPPTERVSVTIPKADAEAELRRVDLRIAALERECALAEGTLRGRDSTLLYAECGRLDEQRKGLERRYDAIELALRALERASESMRERFSPALNADTARLFSELTSGKYNRTLISREFKPEAGDDLQLHPAGDLSSGTTDQLWLALRLAVLHATLPPDTPLILDDALVTFDNERMGRALELLLRESETRQVLLFTCHTRESEYLSGRDGVNVIKL